MKRVQDFPGPCHLLNPAFDMRSFQFVGAILMPIDGKPNIGIGLANRSGVCPVGEIVARRKTWSAFPFSQQGDQPQ